MMSAKRRPPRSKLLRHLSPAWNMSGDVARRGGVAVVQSGDCRAAVWQAAGKESIAAKERPKAIKS